MSKIASVVFAAGRGSRMKDIKRNKTVLPLLPEKTQKGNDFPIILEIIKNLPDGPKAIVINYRKEDVKKVTDGLGLVYCEQKELNGTGGALLAAEDFIKGTPCERFIIAMGDVPFVKRSTYDSLVKGLEDHDMLVLGFTPESKQDYGVLEIKNGQVIRITESKYWKQYPKQVQEDLRICNSGIYALKREVLTHYMPILASRPHTVIKEVDGNPVERREYFLTDIIEYMNRDGMNVGYVLTENEEEVMGVDSPEALERARTIFKKRPSWME